MKCAILGGTFNPIHKGHIHIATQACRILNLDKIFFVPAGVPPHKNCNILTEPVKRLKLTELALKPYYPRFEVLDLEVTSLQTSYTVDTVEKVYNLSKNTKYEDELHLILGIDAFLDISTWKNPERLFELCNFVILPRAGYSLTDVKNISYLDDFDASCLNGLKMNEYKTWKLKRGKMVYFLNCELCDISSTQIRDSIEKGTLPHDSLPPEVESYIIMNNYKLTI